MSRIPKWILILTGFKDEAGAGIILTSLQAPTDLESDIDQLLKHGHWELIDHVGRLERAKDDMRGQMRDV